MCDRHIRVAAAPANSYTQTCLFGKRKIQQQRVDSITCYSIDLRDFSGDSIPPLNYFSPAKLAYLNPKID